LALAVAAQTPVQNPVSAQSPQSSPAQSGPGQGGGAQTTPAQAMGAAAQPAQPAVPQAKTQPEYNAYNAAVSQPNPADEEAAVADFQTKFPTSELTPLLYRDLLQKYQSQNNTGKVIETGRKLIALQPDNPLALVLTAMGISESVTDSDPQKDQKLSEAAKYALHGIETTPTGLLVPANITPLEEQMLKNTLIAMAHGTLGYIALLRAEYPKAEGELQLAVTMNSQPEAVTYLRLAVAQDHENKYADAMANATHAFDLAAQQNNSTMAALASDEKDRLSRLMGGGPSSP